MSNKISAFNIKEINKQKKNLSKDQLKDMESYGELMYSSIGDDVDDYVKNMYGNSCKFIVAGLRSGLEVSELEKKEVEVLENVYGKNWQQKLGIQ